MRKGIVRHASKENYNNLQKIIVAKLHVIIP